MPVRNCRWGGSSVRAIADHINGFAASIGARTQISKLQRRRFGAVQEKRMVFVLLFPLCKLRGLMFVLGHQDEQALLEDRAHAKALIRRKS